MGSFFLNGSDVGVSLKKKRHFGLICTHKQYSGLGGLRYLMLSKFSGSQIVLSLNRIQFGSIGLKCCIIVFLSGKAVGTGHPVFCALKIAQAPFNPIGLASSVVLYFP